MPRAEGRPVLGLTGRVQTDVADVVVAGVSCRNTTVWKDRQLLTCLLVPPFPNATGVGAPVPGTVTVSTLSGGATTAPIQFVNYTVLPCMLPRLCLGRGGDTPRLTGARAGGRGTSAACHTLTSISSCGAAGQEGYGCHWCYARAYCSEATVVCDDGCLGGGSLYLTCSELGGIIALALVTGIITVAVAWFAWHQQKQLDLVGISDV